MKLIDLVRKTRENGHRYFAIDFNDNAYSFSVKPRIASGTFAGRIGTYTFIDNYELTCNWKDSLVDVTKLKGVK